MQLRKKIKAPKKYDDSESELDNPKSISKMKPIPYNPNLPPATFPTIGFGEVAKSDINIPKITTPPGDFLNHRPAKDKKLQDSQEEYGRTTKDNKLQDSQQEYEASDEPCFADNRGAAQSHNIGTSEEWFAAAMETSDEDNGYGAQDEIKKSVPDRSEWDDLSVAHQTDMVIKLEETYKLTRLAVMRQLRLNQRQIRHTMELLDRRDILERREHQGITDTLNETRRILMTGDKDGSRYISERRYREILQTRLYGPAQGREEFHITTLRDLVKAKRYLRNSGHDPQLLDSNWEDAFKNDRISSRSRKSESRKPTVDDRIASASTISLSSDKSSADNAPAEPDMEVPLPVQHYHPPSSPFVSSAQVSRQRALAERNQEKESNGGFLPLPAITISRPRIPTDEPTTSTRSQTQRNSPNSVENFAAATSAPHSSNLLQLPSRTSNVHPLEPNKYLHPTLPDQRQIFSAYPQFTHSNTREPSPQGMMPTNETLQPSTRHKCSAFRGRSEPLSPERVRIKEGEKTLMGQPGAATFTRGIDQVSYPQVVQPSVPVSDWMPQLPKFDNPALPTSSKPVKLNTAFQASEISANAKAMMPRSANSTRPPRTTHTMAKMALSSNVENARKQAKLTTTTKLEVPRPQSAPAFESIAKAAKAPSAISPGHTSVPTATILTQISTATTPANAPLSTTVSQASKKFGDMLGKSTTATETRPNDLFSMPGITPNSITPGGISNISITAQKKPMPAVPTVSQPALPTSASAAPSKATTATGPIPTSAATQKKTRRAPAKSKVMGFEGN